MFEGGIIVDAIFCVAANLPSYPLFMDCVMDYDPMPDIARSLLSGSSLLFTSQHAQELIAQIPELRFDLAHDQALVETPGAQTYLNFYSINFAKYQNYLGHGFGYVMAAGFRIATHYWLPLNPVSPPKGTLVIVHGYYDHVGVFDKAIAFGLQQGFAVMAFDLPGHGLSSGEQVAIDSFDQYADVLETLLQSARHLLPAPYYALGQSTGGAVLLNHLWRYGQQPVALPFAGIALCAPLILPYGWGSGRWRYALLHHFVKRMKRGPSQSSHDEAFNRFVDNQDCLQSRFLSVRWVGAMKEWNARFRQFPPLLTPQVGSKKPVLVVQGDEDMTVDWRYNLTHIQHALPGTKIAMIPGARHQLVNEELVLREKIFMEISRHFFSD